MTTYTLKDITRPSGGFAMLAVDQREAMRLMFAAAGTPMPVTDQHLTDFKVNAARFSRRMPPRSCLTNSFATARR